MHRRDHLVAQLAHAEDDHRRLKVDVGVLTEHLAEATGDPPTEDRGDTRVFRQPARDVPQQRLHLLHVSGSHSGLDDRAFRLVEPAAHGCAQVDGVGRGGTQPGLVALVPGAEVEDVQRVPRAQRELDVDASK